MLIFKTEISSVKTNSASTFNVNFNTKKKIFIFLQFIINRYYLPIYGFSSEPITCQPYLNYLFYVERSRCMVN